MDLLAERVVQVGGTAAGTIQGATARTGLHASPLTLAEARGHGEARASALAASSPCVRQGMAQADARGGRDTAAMCTAIARGVDTSSGAWRPTAGRPPARRPAPARDGLPGAAHHDRKGRVMRSPTHVEREHPVDVAVDPRLSRGVKAFLQVLHAAGGPPLETLPPREARAVLAHAQAAVPVDLSGIAESEKTINTDGYTIPLNIVRPAGATGPRPVSLFMHGGGWVLGDYPTHKRMVRDLVVLSGFPGVFVNYTRTPEARYPQAVKEIYAATTWVAEHGEEIGVDGHTLAVVGNSVGGNMTAVTALKAKEQGCPAIQLQIMMWPIVDANFDTASYRQFGEQRFLTTSLMRWMYDLYTADPRSAKPSTPRRCRRRWSNDRACLRRSSRSRKAISCATRAKPTGASWTQPASR